MKITNKLGDEQDQRQCLDVLFKYGPGATASDAPFLSLICFVANIHYKQTKK